MSGPTTVDLKISLVGGIENLFIVSCYPGTKLGPRQIHCHFMKQFYAKHELQVSDLIGAEMPERMTARLP